MDLTTDRAIGFGEGPIPWSRIEQYCDAHDIYGEQREDMHAHMRSMDTAYLEQRSKKIRAESASKSKSAKGKASG